MSNIIITRPLTATDFAPYGDVLDCSGNSPIAINQGKCNRFDDLADLDFTDGRAGISVFKSKTCSFPYDLKLVERHPLGSQAFIPMSHHAFMIVVADDQKDIPVNPQAFISKAGQAVNLHKGTWHGVLTPLHEPGLFAVIDRIGTGDNLQEHRFENSYQIQQG